MTCRAMVPAHVESDVDLLEANMEPTPSKKTSWWPLGFAIAAVGLFVLVGVAFKTHRRYASQVSAEGAAGYFENITADIPVRVVHKPWSEFSELAKKFTDGLKKKRAISEKNLHAFGRESVLKAKAFMERNGEQANVFGGVCDSFNCTGCAEGNCTGCAEGNCSGCDEGKAIMKIIPDGAYKFCLVMGPQSSEFTIRIKNPDADAYFLAGHADETWGLSKKTNSIGRKSLTLSFSFGEKAKNFSAGRGSDASLSS
eukprot:Skav206310  [mRNA]  locus=scaffold4747:121693:122457:+ [translate_table: standard]